MRPERQFLLSIREGKYKYNQLERMAETKIALIEQAYIASKIRDKVDRNFVNDLHFTILKDHLMALWLNNNSLLDMHFP
jgi:uncharacterized protein (DUF1499 family)